MEFSVKWNCLDGAQKKYQEDLVKNRVSLLTSGLAPKGGGRDQLGLLAVADLAPLPRLVTSAKPGRPPGGESTSQVVSQGCYFLLGPQLAGGGGSSARGAGEAAACPHKLTQTSAPASGRHSEKPRSEPAPSGTVAATALNPREFCYSLTGKVEHDCQTGDLQRTARLKTTINIGLGGKTEKPSWRREGISQALYARHKCCSHTGDLLQSACPMQSNFYV